MYTKEKGVFGPGLGDRARVRSMGVSVGGLVLIVLLEYLFIKFSWFSYLPHMGVVFHLGGGFLVALFFYYLFQSATKILARFPLLLFLTGCVALASISWEVIEWVISFFIGQTMNQNIDAMIFDLVIGPLGGIICWLYCLKSRK